MVKSMKILLTDAEIKPLLGIPKTGHITEQERNIAKAQLKTVRDMIDKIARSNLYDEEKWCAVLDLLKEVE